jgi:hypothetical protein
MSDPANTPPADGFTAASPDVIAPGEGELIVNLEGFEGPLDLLLGLRAIRRSICGASRWWRWSTSTCPTSRRPAGSAWNSPPTIS